MALVDVPLTRDFPHPPDAAYAWLTDFRTDDGAIAGALIEGRDSVDRKGDEVRMVTRIRRPFGAVRTRTQHVTLHPRERRWESRITAGYGAGSFHRYRLLPHANGCRLEVVYGFGTKGPLHAFGLRLAKPLLRRQLDKMWDGFEAAMGHDLDPRPRA